jgi:hypothetical protein
LGEPYSPPSFVSLTAAIIAPIVYRVVRARDNHRNIAHASIKNAAAPEKYLTKFFKIFA